MLPTFCLQVGMMCFSVPAHGTVIEPIYLEGHIFNYACIENRGNATGYVGWQADKVVFVLKIIMTDDVNFCEEPATS